MNTYSFTPETKPDGTMAFAGLRFASKRDVAAFLGMSTRWVETEMAKGMPHLKLGPRRVRFDLGEVATYLRDRYAQRRRGPAPSTRVANAAVLAAQEAA